MLVEYRETGSRSASVAGRIPIADACCKLADDLRKLGFQTPSGTLAVSTWVDNVTSLAHSATDATEILHRLHQRLNVDWLLNFKESSMELMSALPLDVDVFNGFNVCSQLGLLGHYLSDNGHLWYAWSEVKKRVMAALFAKFRCCNISVLTLEGIAAQIDLHLWPIVSFRSNNWPFCKHIADAMDALQTLAISLAAAIPPMDGEPVSEFHRRRAKTAGVAAAARGRWSLRWAKQVMSWDEHVRRNSTGRLWGAAVLELRPDSWLRQQRRRFVPFISRAIHPLSDEAGRLGTRARRGQPAKRWEEGASDAREYVQNERISRPLRLPTRKTKQKFMVKHVASVTPEELQRFDDFA